jgi:hypothetical protein
MWFVVVTHGRLGLIGRPLDVVQRIASVVRQPEWCDVKQPDRTAYAKAIIPTLSRGILV